MCCVEYGLPGNKREQNLMIYENHSILKVFKNLVAVAKIDVMFILPII